MENKNLEEEIHNLLIKAVEDNINNFKWDGVTFVFEDLKINAEKEENSYHYSISFKNINTELSIEEFEKIKFKLNNQIKTESDNLQSLERLKEIYKKSKNGK